MVQNFRDAPKALGALAQATSVRLVLAIAAVLWFSAAGLATRGIQR